MNTPLALAIGALAIYMVCKDDEPATVPDPTTSDLTTLLANAELPPEDWTAIGDAVATLQAKINSNLV